MKKILQDVFYYFFEMGKVYIEGKFYGMDMCNMDVGEVMVCSRGVEMSTPPVTDSQLPGTDVLRISAVGIVRSK